MQTIVFFLYWLNKKNIPTTYQAFEQTAKKARVGRPVNAAAEEAFEKICSHLEENDDEQTTVSDLVQRMKATLGESSTEVYSTKYMKKKLQQRFRDKIVFTEINGKPNVVTFRTKAKHILHDYYKNRDSNPEKEKMAIISTAAKLIKADIKQVITDHTVYPDFSMLSNIEECEKFVPESMQTYLDTLITAKSTELLKASLGHALMQATRPRVLMVPLQVGLGIQLYHQFGSRFFIDTLHKHGFTCSYREVQSFEQNAAIAHGTDIPNCNEKVIQHVADNVDHNIRTVDGFGTIHIMGMIVCFTPAAKSSTIIPRIKVTSTDIAQVGCIPICYHRGITKGPSRITYKMVLLDKAPDPSADFDILWKSSILFGQPRPSWSGTMQVVHRGNHPPKSSIMFLPMINMDPNNETCIYSTLSYVTEHAMKHNSTPILTFDQPLYHKALMLCLEEPEGSPIRKIVLKMGGLHTKMSYVGTFGYLMSSSGMREVVETIYAPNTVDHIFSGKAIARAIRAHILIDAALNGLLLSQVLAVPLVEEEANLEYSSSSEDAPSRQLCESLNRNYRQLIDGEKLDIRDESCISQLQEILSTQKESLCTSRTAKLWIQYMDMVDVMKKYIRAERTGNWKLHLEATLDMLPYFAAAGHNSYLKSSLLHLQQMAELESDNPEVYHHFMNGLHVIRRSEREWAGLSADLVIEQVLMRSLKTSGGLTRGRGFTEQQQVIWTLSMPVCASVHNTMLELTGVQKATGEQNQDISPSRMARDWKDSFPPALFESPNLLLEGQSHLWQMQFGI